jgi:hypothetical protein
MTLRGVAREDCHYSLHERLDLEQTILRSNTRFQCRKDRRGPGTHRAMDSRAFVFLWIPVQDIFLATDLSCRRR